MKRKYKILISVILFVLTVILCVCGVLLFNSLPNVTTNGYTDPKDALVMMGVCFSFLFATFSLGGCVGVLIWAFVDTADGYYY